MNNKILFFLSSLNAGGAERFTVYLINYLHRNGFNVKLALFRKTGPFLKNLDAGVEIIDLKAPRARNSIFKVLKVIIKEQPKVVYSIAGQTNIVISFLIPFLKKVVFIGRETSIPSKRIPNGVFGFILKKLLKRIKNFNYLIAISNAMKEDLVKNFNIEEEKIKIFPNVIEIEKVRKLSEEKVELNHKKINLITVSRLEKVKGIDRMLNILKKLNKDDDRYLLNIVGDGSELKKLENLVYELQLEKSVKFWGYQENPFKLVSKCQCFLLTSYSESFGNVILEANACGKYVIAFNCPGGVKEIISEGINGSLVDDGNIEEYVKKINNLKNKKLNIEEIFECANKFSYDVQLLKYKHFFQKIIRGEKVDL